MWLHIVFIPRSHWVAAHQCACACALDVYVTAESGYARFASCLFQSSRPVLHLGGWDAACEGSSGSFLLLDSLFRRCTPRPPNLLMNKTSGAVEVCFSVEADVCKHLMYSSQDNWRVPHYLTVCMCVVAAVGVEMSACCLAPSSRIWALSVYVHIATQNPPNFPHIPSICLDSSQPASGFLRLLSHCLQSDKLGWSLFSLWNKLQFCLSSRKVIYWHNTGGVRQHSCCEA